MSETKTIDDVREEAFRRDDAYFYDTCYGMTGGDLISGPAFRRVSRQMATYSLEAVVKMLNDAHNAMAKRLRDAEARNMRSICTYCGYIEEAATEDARFEGMADHMLVCERHPAKRYVLLASILEEILSEGLTPERLAEARALLAGEAARGQEEAK